MVNFSPLVGWSHSICMFHADLFHDPGQHPTSRLYLPNNLFALCILVWVTDIYFYFDIWTTEPTSGILAGTHARPILAVSLQGTEFRQKSWELSETLQHRLTGASHEQHLVLERWDGTNMSGQELEKRDEWLLFVFIPWRLSGTPLYDVRSPSLSGLMESRWNRNVNSVALASLPLTPCISLALCSLRRICGIMRLSTKSTGRKGPLNIDFKD